MRKSSIYIILGIFGTVNAILFIVFGAFLPTLYSNIGELGNQTITTPSVNAKFNNNIGPSSILARVFGIIAVCTYIGMLMWAVLNAFSKEPETEWEEL